MLVKEYNKISKYKDVEIGIEKIAVSLNYHRTIYDGSPGYDKNWTDKHINKIFGGPSLYKIQKVCTLRNHSSSLVNIINMIGKITCEITDER